MMQTVMSFLRRVVSIIIVFCPQVLEKDNKLQKLIQKLEDYEFESLDEEYKAYANLLRIESNLHVLLSSEPDL